MAASMILFFWINSLRTLCLSCCPWLIKGKVLPGWLLFCNCFIPFGERSLKVFCIEAFLLRLRFGARFGLKAGLEKPVYDWDMFSCPMILDWSRRLVECFWKMLLSYILYYEFWGFWAVFQLSISFLCDFCALISAYLTYSGRFILISSYFGWYL